MQTLAKIENYFKSFKRSKKTLMLLIAIDLFLAIGSNINDFHIIAKVDPWLIPLAPICSLYPLLLAIWFILYYKKIKIPQLFTLFIFIGIVSYGLMAQIYYPLFIYWYGFAWNLAGNMVWVAMYAIQAFIIASELRPVSILTALPIYAYFALKDYSDYAWGTFTDVLYYDFPPYSSNLLLALIVSFQIFAITIARIKARSSTS